ncbi:MAG: VOC family protein [Pseudomonadota bacterium]
MQPNTYLFFAGDCFEAMSHYADALGGEVTHVMRNSDAGTPEDRMPGPDDMVLNMGLKLGETMMFGSDNSSEMYQAPRGFRLQLEDGSAEEFDRLYEALGGGARTIDMPAGETFWADRFAMFTDRFGTPWMLNFTGSKG